jgi:hypothetical protein
MQWQIKMERSVVCHPDALAGFYSARAPKVRGDNPVIFLKILLK